MNPIQDSATFGAPGIAPRGISSAQEGLGTAYQASCRHRFTLNGIIVDACQLIAEPGPFTAKDLKKRLPAETSSPKSDS